MTKKIRTVGLIVIGILAVGQIVVIKAFITLFLMLALVPIKITDKNKYLQTDGAFSKFVVFPETIDGLDVRGYHYYDYHLVDGREVVLTVKYDGVSFNDELSRLDGVEVDIFGEIKTVAKDKDGLLFNYFTYVSIYNPKGVYEYACVDFDQCEITYVYVDFMSLKRTAVKHQYLPKRYFSENQLYQNYHFNIYYDEIDIWL